MFYFHSDDASTWKLMKHSEFKNIFSYCKLKQYALYDMHICNIILGISSCKQLMKISTGCGIEAHGKVGFKRLRPLLKMFIFLTTIQIVLSTEQFEKTWSDNINVKISNYFLAPFRF